MPDTPSTDYALYVIGFPSQEGDYDLLDFTFRSKEEAVAHATEHQAEWVDYVVLPLGQPVHTYTWNDETGARIDRSEDAK